MCPSPSTLLPPSSLHPPFPHLSMYGISSFQSLERPRTLCMRVRVRVLCVCSCKCARAGNLNLFSPMANRIFFFVLFLDQQKKPFSLTDTRCSLLRGGRRERLPRTHCASLAGEARSGDRRLPDRQPRRKIERAVAGNVRRLLCLKWHGSVYCFFPLFFIH